MTDSAATPGPGPTTPTPTKVPIAAPVDPPIPHCPYCGKLSTSVVGKAFHGVPKCDGRCREREPVPGAPAGTPDSSLLGTLRHLAQVAQDADSAADNYAHIDGPEFSAARYADLIAEARTTRAVLSEYATPARLLTALPVASPDLRREQSGGDEPTVEALLDFAEAWYPSTVAIIRSRLAGPSASSAVPGAAQGATPFTAEGRKIQSGWARSAVAGDCPFASPADRELARTILRYEATIASLTPPDAASPNAGGREATLRHAIQFICDALDNDDYDEARRMAEETRAGLEPPGGGHGET